MSSKLLVSAYDTVASNTWGAAKKLTGVAKRRMIQVDPKKIAYDAKRNRYFQPTKNSSEIYRYTEDAATACLARRGGKAGFEKSEVYECMDNFMDRSGYLPTSEFRVMRDKEGKILGGFSSNIDGDSLHVSSFYLDDKAKKRGVIREMYEDIKRRAQENNCKNITADVCGKEELKRSERMGFKEKKTNFWQTLLEWNVLDKYLGGNRKVTCSVDDFGKNWTN